MTSVQLMNQGIQNQEEQVKILLDPKTRGQLGYMLQFSVTIFGWPRIKAKFEILWKKVWSFWIPHKAKIFEWRELFHSLPTIHNHANCGLPLDSICSFCKQTVHVLWIYTCRGAKQCLDCREEQCPEMRQRELVDFSVIFNLPGKFDRHVFLGFFCYCLQQCQH